MQTGYMTLNLLMKSGLHSHAKAVSYSVLPLMLLLVHLVNLYLADYPEVSEAVSSMIFFTRLNFLNQNIPQSASQIVYMIPAWVSIIAILWVSRGLFKSIQSAFTVIFGDSEGGKVSGQLLPLIVPLVLLTIPVAVFVDHMIFHIDYSSMNMPLLEMAIKFFFGLMSMVIFVLCTWIITFLLYYFLPQETPNLSSTLICSLLFIVSASALILVLGHILKLDQFSGLYGMLGQFIYVLIWVYFGSILFFFWAEFLYVSENIDVFALERIFFEKESLSRLEYKIERFLFNRSTRIFEKYGQHFKAGETIIKQNDESDSVYFLYSGNIGLYREEKGKQVKVGIVKEKEIFGEMAYLLMEKRTATAVAESECFLFVISPIAFEEIVSRSTFFSARVIQSLCQRIFKLNQGRLTSELSSTNKHPILNSGSGEV